MSEILQAGPEVPGDLGPDSSARGVDQQARATQARVRVRTVLTSCPGRLAPGSEGLLCRRAHPGDSRSGGRVHSVVQLPRETRAQVRVPAGLTRSPGQLVRGSESPWGRSALPGDSASGTMARGVDQHSRATRDWMRGAAESTSCPGNLGPVRCPGRPRPGFQCLPRRPDFPGDSDKGRRARGVDQLSQVTRAVLEVLRARPAVLGHSGPCLRSCGLDQLSREARARVRGPTVSTSSPGNPRFAPNAREFGQLSR